MDCRLKCEKPGEIEYTLTVTMKAREWEAFREQLGSAWPSWQFTQQINDLLGQARKIYWPAVASDPQ
jgi:hypothetical protein